MDTKKMNNSEYYSFAQSHMFRKLIQAEEDNKKLMQENSKLLNHLLNQQNQMQSLNESFKNTINSIKYCHRLLSRSCNTANANKVLQTIDDILFLSEPNFL